MTITGMTRFVQQNYKVQNSHLTHKLPKTVRFLFQVTMERLTPE